MRTHVYTQELTREVKLISKTADTGIHYFGVQFLLHSSDRLHHTPDDDDRSAVTFWIPNAESMSAEDLAEVFEEAARLCRDSTKNPGVGNVVDG